MCSHLGVTILVVLQVMCLKITSCIGQTIKGDRNKHLFIFLCLLPFFIYVSKKSPNKRKTKKTQTVQFSKEHHVRLLNDMYFSYFICHYIHCATFHSILNILCGYIFYGATVVAASEFRSALAILHCTPIVQHLASLYNLLLIQRFWRQKKELFISFLTILYGAPHYCS